MLDMNPNRSTRKISQPCRESNFMGSQQSVFRAMDRFVKAVNDMHSTVLVPSRLQDIDVTNENNELPRRLPAIFDGTDCYSSFSMFTDVQTELLWGPTSEFSVCSRSSSGRSSPISLGVMRYIRQLSDNSQKSDCDVESVFTDPESVDEQATSYSETIASTFRYHLLGLHTILHELADSADYLSSRYLDEFESSST